MEKHKRIGYSRIALVFFLALGVAITVPGAFNSFHMVKFYSYRTLMMLKYVWLVFVPYSFIALAAMLRNPRRDFDLEKIEQRGNYTVIFQITTRGLEIDAVKRSVNSVLFWAPKYLKKFEVWIVTEEDIPEENRRFFEEISQDDHVRVLYVPRDFRTPRGTMYKARALCYAAKVRELEGLARSDVWVYLMDEESVVGEDTVLSIIEFVERYAPRGKLVAQGMIVYPNFWGRNIFTSIADISRIVQDITLYRLQFTYGRPFLAVHGSHLLVRADVEKEVGWDFGPVRAEDLIFGLVVAKRFGRVWGWLRGKLYEQSPFTLKDYAKQRRRWMWGLMDVVRCSDVALRDRILVAFNIASWLLAIPSIAISVINVFIPTPLPHPWLAIPLGLALGVGMYTYLVSCNIAFTAAGIDGRWEKLKHLVLAVMLAIPITIAECSMVWYALLTYHRSRRVGFELIKK